MNILSVNFQELYQRHLCRHSQLDINVVHVVSVLGTYMAVCGLFSALGAPEWMVLLLMAVYLAILVFNIPLRVFLLTVLFLSVVFLASRALPRLLFWYYAVVIFLLYKAQAWSHKLYTRATDMAEFNKKYRKGITLFVLLSIYELPVLLNYLFFGKKDWCTPSGDNAGSPLPERQPDLAKRLVYMQTEMIQRQYDEIIAEHYDADPQSVIGNSLDRAVQQIAHLEAVDGRNEVLRILDLGLGTGRFLEKVRSYAGPRMQPYGLDISQKMIDIACARIADLSAAVGDATNLEAHFSKISFNLVATHFITGFVPMEVLAPKIYDKLQKGGLWSFVGGTMAGFPNLRTRVQGKLAKLLLRIKSLDVGEMVCNPADERAVEETLERRHGFRVRALEVFCPPLSFKNFDEFLDFAYYGGWLTPIVEHLRLHRAAPSLQAIWNGLFFPVHDHHRVVIALAQKS